MNSITTLHGEGNFYMRFVYLICSNDMSYHVLIRQGIVEESNKTFMENKALTPEVPSYTSIGRLFIYFAFCLLCDI